MWLFSYFVCIKELPGFRLNKKSIIKIFVSLAVFIAVVSLLKQVLIFDIYTKAILIATISFVVYLLFGVFVVKAININLIKEEIQKARK